MEKTIPCRWFMGCNSQNGFYSLFGQFTRPEEGWRCILIKGGPGTGKSTLMKRVIKLALQRGQPVEEIHCSSDAASLDGVILPRQRTVLLDATPPHALEPQFPGAVEQPFSLCGCWDEELLFTRREEIVRLGREISGLHWQAVRYLSGAGALLGEVRRLAAETLNWEKIEHYVQRLAARELPDRGKPGSEALRLLSAVTDRGTILFMKQFRRCASGSSAWRTPAGRQPRHCCPGYGMKQWHGGTMSSAAPVPSPPKSWIIC